MVTLGCFAADSRQWQQDLGGFDPRSDVRVIARPTSGQQLACADIISPDSGGCEDPCSSSDLARSAEQSPGPSACADGRSNAPILRGDTVLGLSFSKVVPGMQETPFFGQLASHTSFDAIQRARHWPARRS